MIERKCVHFKNETNLCAIYGRMVCCENCRMKKLEGQAMITLEEVYEAIDRVPLHESIRQALTTELNRVIGEA